MHLPRALLVVVAVSSGAVVAATTEGTREALPGAEPFPAGVRAELDRALAAREPGFVPRTRNRDDAGRPLYSNRLLLESSPYLQQHAHNPVDWWPWGDEAFARARALGRPVFVSIGYSTCHWCHVMEEESFDDPEIARMLNTHFVAIKVDREVRPDVDAIYMTALHAMGRRGGWPLNLFLTPDGEPFFGGTYFPKQDRDDRIGFARLLGLIQQRWTVDRDSIDELAERVSGAVREALESQTAQSRELDVRAVLEQAEQSLAGVYDPAEGGARGAPKFPASFPVTVLLRQHLRTGEPEPRQMAEKTLTAMAAGGLRDHLGGGFHRYSTDARWIVPHFEKMLYDNALLTLDYLEAAQVTGREDFFGIVRETLDYVAREMTGPEGAFYSATDADSANDEGELEEGFFFTWTPSELAAVLGARDGALVAAWFGVDARGSLEGRSVLHRRTPEAELAEATGTPALELRRIVERSKPHLLEARARRPAPLRDEKRLAAWNGLMISAFARAGFVLDEPAYRERARRAAAFVLDRMRDETGALHRVHLDGRARGPAFLEDYAFVIAGLLDLYEATGESRWLVEAQRLQTLQDRDFGGPSGYARTSNRSPALLAREVSARDGAIPSGNSISALNLLRLEAWSGDPTAQGRATALLVAFAPQLEARPTGSSRMLLALDWIEATPREVALVGPSGASFGPMLDPLRMRFDPHHVLSVATEGPDLEAQTRATALLAGKTARGGRVTAYVCRDRVCDRPTTDPVELVRQLERARMRDELR